MNKILLIIQREYLTRVKTKTFILLTLLAPILYGLLIMMPVLATKFGKETKTVAVVDESGKFQNISSSNKNLVIYNAGQPLKEVEKGFAADKESFYILHIPKSFDIFKPEGIELISPKHVGIFFKSSMDSLLENRLSSMRMAALNIPQSTIDSLHAEVDVKISTYTDKGTISGSSGATTAAAYLGGVLIYMFIFLYGTMVTRGVQEEKQSRVVEIIISSVRPFQLMMGKIIGVALVGLTQFAIWILLTIAITTITGQALSANHMGPAMGSQSAGAAQGSFSEVMSALGTLPIPLLIGMFLFYFIGGYLLYSSIFAAVASAVDSQADMSQFMLPISLPIIFSIVSISSVIESPDGPLASWLSMIPLTSPIIMMARIPFESFSGESNFTGQLILSMLILIAGFIVSTWMAAKIYRTGILMYGKKITWKELGKWVFYKG